jgi:hypothetical protein
MTWLLVWYSLGWVAAGVEFATSRHSGDHLPLACCFLLPLLALFACSAEALARASIGLRRGQQYLWRKP